MTRIQSSFVTLLVSILAVAYGAPQTGCTPKANRICFGVGVPATSAQSGSGNIYFQISAPTSNAWVALGTGDQMAQSNMFIMYQDGNGNVTISPRQGVRWRMPTLDTSPTAARLTLLAGSGVSADGSMMIANVACSNCQSWNGGSMSLQSTQTSWICAWKSGQLATTDGNAIISQHDEHDNLMFDLVQARIDDDSNPFVASGGGGTGQGSGGGSNPGGAAGGANFSGASSPSQRIVVAHGIIMALVFVVFYPVAAMLMPLLGKWQIHAGTQTLSFLLMWVGFGLGIQAGKERRMLFDEKHTLIGTIVVSLLFVQPFLGLAHHRHYVKHQRRGIVSYVHMFWGQALIVVGLVNGGLGLELSGASNSLVVAYAVVAAVIFTVYAIIKAFTLFKAKHAATLPHGGNKEAPSPPTDRVRPPGARAAAPPEYYSHRRPYP